MRTARRRCGYWTSVPGRSCRACRWRLRCQRPHVTLLDKVWAKVAFLRQAQLELRLPNVDVVHARVEQLRAPPFDVILARAFATLLEAGTSF